MNNLLEIHYNSKTHNVFNFLSGFMADKFYNRIYELSKQYSIKNGLSISDNYKNIFDSYMDTLTINSADEEESKNRMFGFFLEHLYESYTKYINNNILSVNGFIILINGTFLPDSYKDDTYTKNKNNLSILFHTLIYTYSKELYKYINSNMDNIILTRVKENYNVLNKQCIHILCDIRSQIFYNFEQHDIHIEKEDNELILNSELYKDVKKELIKCKSDLNTAKKMLENCTHKENKLKTYITKLIKLINLLSPKDKTVITEPIIYNDQTQTETQSETPTESETMRMQMKMNENPLLPSINPQHCLE